MKPPMSRSRIVPILMSLLVLGVAAPAFAVPMDWGYGEPGGKLAPEEWDMISATCGTGQQQSPIDFQQSRLSDTHSRVRTSNLPDIAFDYHATEIVLKNTGHNIEVEYESTPESAITVGRGTPFDVVQFHFHAPAEHTFEDGAAFPMELHIVHRSADNRLAVVGVMIREGQENAVLADLWDLLTDAANLVPNANDEYDSGEEIDIGDALPADRRYFAYDGSLTTPPCSEGVEWRVLREPIEMSREQIHAFKDMIATHPALDFTFGNARPAQPLNGRKIKLDHSPKPSRH